MIGTLTPVRRTDALVHFASRELAKQLSIGGQYPGAARFDGGHDQSGSALFAACPGIGRRCRRFRSVGAVIEQLSPIKTL
jgi:hypothetical protein